MELQKNKKRLTRRKNHVAKDLRKYPQKTETPKVEYKRVRIKKDYRNYYEEPTD